MKIQNFLFTGAFCAILFASCSDDDNNNMEVPSAVSDLYATSHADGNVTRYNLTTGNVASYNTNVSDAEGIYYSPNDEGSFTIAPRGDSQTALQSYENIEDLSDFELDITGPDVMDSPRDLAVNGAFYVVSDNANDQGRFFIFERGSDEFTLRNIVTVDFPVWGIEFIDSALYAVVDSSSDLAVFNNFLDHSGNDVVTASKRITIEGIVRTHGLDYDGNTMIMTDIAAASGDNFDTDGAFHVISDFNSKFNNVENGGTLSVSDQTRYAGNATFFR